MEWRDLQLTSAAFMIQYREIALMLTEMLKSFGFLFQSSSDGCNVAMLHAISECYIQCSNVTWNMRMLPAMEQCELQRSNDRCNIPMIDPI